MTRQADRSNSISGRDCADFQLLKTLPILLNDAVLLSTSSPCPNNLSTLYHCARSAF